MSSLESGKYSIAFSSGCAAITTLMMLLENGDEVISSEEISGSGRGLFSRVIAKKISIKFNYIDCTNLKTVENAIKTMKNVKMIFLETPSNPCLRLNDIEEIAKLCKIEKIILAVDSTFATPYL